MICEKLFRRRASVVRVVISFRMLEGLLKEISHEDSECHHLAKQFDCFIGLSLTRISHPLLLFLN